MRGLVYTAAVRMEETPRANSRCSASLQLTPGKEDKWEGKPIDVALPPDMRGLPLLGPGAGTTLLFATSACVHEGHYFLGTKENGIFVFPFNNNPPKKIRIAEGCPRMSSSR